jgi:hypothetical protein
MYVHGQLTSFRRTPEEARCPPRASLDAVEQRKIHCLWRESNSDYKLSLSSGSVSDIRKRSYYADLFDVNAGYKCRTGLDISEQPTWYNSSLRAGRSGDRIPLGGEIFRTRPDRPWGPPSLLCSGQCVIPGGKAAGGVELTTHPLLAPRLKKEYKYFSAPLLDFRGLFWCELYLYLYLLLHKDHLNFSKPCTGQTLFFR